MGSTASNCSYHLRTLARFGLVEAVEAEDGRERPWRSVATGLRFGRTGEPGFDLGAETAERLLADRQIDDQAELEHRALAQLADEPEEWRAASSLSGYALRLTAAELEELVDDGPGAALAPRRGDPQAVGPAVRGDHRHRELGASDVQRQDGRGGRRATVAGDVTVRLPHDRGVDVEARSVSGRVVIDGQEHKGANVGQVKVSLPVGGATCYVVCSSVTGHLTVLHAAEVG